MGPPMWPRPMKAMRMVSPGGVFERRGCQRRLMVVLTPVFTEASSNQRVVTVLVWV